MRLSVFVAVALVAGCSTAPATSTVAPSLPASPSRESWIERDYLDALRMAQVPVSRTGESEINIGRGVCAEIARGTDPEALADDVLLSVPGWSSDNVTAAIRTAMEVLC